MRKMRKTPSFDEEKTTQIAALLLKLNEGELNYMKLIKLLYNIDREAIKRWHHPLTFDQYYSLQWGQILSKTLDKAKDQSPGLDTYWDEFIKTKGWSSLLIDDPGFDRLSQAEIELVKEVDDKYKGFSQFDMGREHHELPEYEEPVPITTNVRTDYEKLFRALGFSDEEIEEAFEELEKLNLIEALA